MTDIKNSKSQHPDALPLNFDKYSDSHDDPVKGPRAKEPPPPPTDSNKPGFVPGQTDEKSARQVEKG